MVHTVPAKARGRSAGRQAVLARAIRTTPRRAAGSTIQIGRAKADLTTIRKRTKTFNGKQRARASGLFRLGAMGNHAGLRELALWQQSKDKPGTVQGCMSL